jgi:hypothetical protein
MTTQNFPFKAEELPVLGDFIISNYKRDAKDFVAYSPLFTPEYPVKIEEKIVRCRTAVQAVSVIKERKKTTATLTLICQNLRQPLNRIEGYIDLSSSELDISPRDFGLRPLRNNISRGNVEGISANLQALLLLLKRNQVALEKAGMTEPMLNELETAIGEINTLNLKQSNLLSNRSILTENNIKQFNDLWKDLQVILKTGKVIYKGNDPAKLKDYTLTSLRKQINMEG